MGDELRPWVPVSEGKPPAGQMVLVTVRPRHPGDGHLTGPDFVRRAYYDGDVWRSVGAGSLQLVEVTAWMLLPEPWQEGVR